MLRTRTAALCLAIIPVLVLCGQAMAEVPLLVAGSPGYDAVTGNGFNGGAIPFSPGGGVNNSGIAVGYSSKYVAGSNKGNRAVRWDAGGTTATELENLGADASGVTYANANAVNDTGTVVGYSQKYVSGSSKGDRAVRWDAGTTTPAELGNLGTDANGIAFAYAYAVNDAGTAVGSSEKYVSGSDMGLRAVRWDASGTTATELGTLGTNNLGRSDALAWAINAAGVIVGYGAKYTPEGFYLGYRAVRWDASGTEATELDHLGTRTSGETFALAYAVSPTGTVVGICDKYVANTRKGQRAVRWNAGGTAATELGDLGTDISGNTNADAYAVNAAGTAVGDSRKYVTGSAKGYRAVRWEAGGTVATELGNLGTSSNGSANASAFSVNDAGTAVGYSEKYVSGSLVGNRAVIWAPDAAAIDLNALGIVPVPAGGTWTLTYARAISADGFVAGEGTFDPDGAGPLASYTRLWVAQVGLGGSWVNTTGSNNTWGKGANWSTGTPAIQRDADFDRLAAYRVGFDKDQSARAAHVTAGDVTFALGGNVLTLTDGLAISGGARLASNGRIVATVTNAGTLAPGNSPGTLVIDGDLTNTGTLEFEVNGSAAGQFDRLVVNGQANVGGTLKVILGYTPGEGDSFDLADWSSLVDGGYSFDFSQAALPDGLSWDTSGFATGGSLSVVPEPCSLALLAVGAVVLRRSRCRR